MPDLIPIYKHTLSTLNLSDWNQRYKNSYLLLNKQIQYIHSVVTKDGRVCFAIPKPVAKKEKKAAPVVGEEFFRGWEDLAEAVLPDRMVPHAAGWARRILDGELVDIPPPPEPRRDFDEAIPGIPHSAAIKNTPEKSSYVYTAINVVSSELDANIHPILNLEFTRPTTATELVFRFLGMQAHWYDISVRETYRGTIEHNMLRALSGEHEKYRPLIYAMPGEIWEFILFYMKNMEQAHFWMHLDFGDQDRVGRTINDTIRSLFFYLMNKLEESALIHDWVEQINANVRNFGRHILQNISPELFRAVMSCNPRVRTELDRLCGATIRWPTADRDWIVPRNADIWDLRVNLDNYRQAHGIQNPAARRAAVIDRGHLVREDIPVPDCDYIPVDEADIELRRPRSRWYWSKGAKGQDLAVFLYSPNRKQFTRGLTPENTCTMFLDANSRHVYPNARVSEQQKAFYQDAYLRADDKPQQRSVSDLKKYLKDKGLTTKILCPEIAMTAKTILYRNQEIAELGDKEEVTLHHRFRHMELELGELLTNPKFIYGYNR